MCEAVRVEYVGTAAAVKARVDTEHGVVQRLQGEYVYEHTVAEHLVSMVWSCTFTHLCTQYLRINAKVSQRGQFCKQRLDVGLDGTLYVPM